MKYNDEISDESDLAVMVCFLLSYTKYKSFLLGFFEMALGKDSFDGLEEVVQHWRDEQEEGAREETSGLDNWSERDGDTDDKFHKDAWL